MFKNKKKTTVLATLLVVAVAGAALAYWTAGGSGTGSADTGDVDPLAAVQTSVLDPMYPGDSAQTLSGNFNNPNDGPVWVTSVTVSIDSVDKDAGAVAGDCDASDYTLANATMTVNAEVPSGTGVGAWTGATIQFNNKVSNQDACKLATVNLSYSIT